jgi:hypothetical protein
MKIEGERIKFTTGEEKMRLTTAYMMGTDENAVFIELTNNLTY